MEAQTVDFYLVQRSKGITYTLEPVSLSLTKNNIEDLIRELTKVSMGKKGRARCTFEAFVRTMMMQKMVVSVVTYLPLKVSVRPHMVHDGFETRLTPSDRRGELFTSLPRLSSGSKTTQTPHRHAPASKTVHLCL